jgi:hypothetical protein
MVDLAGLRGIGQQQWRVQRAVACLAARLARWHRASPRRLADGFAGSGLPRHLSLGTHGGEGHSGRFAEVDGDIDRRRGPLP